jgi:hypothetical protein
MHPNELIKELMLFFRTSEHSLGGDVIAEFSASLTSSLPSPFPDFIKTHVFFDAGSTGGQYPPREDES